MLDARKGEALLAVIDTGSFEQAAVQLHLTPSAVSQRISAMESELGMPLIIRSKPCRATPAGQRLVQYLRRARLLEEEFLADSQPHTSGPLSVTVAVNHDTLATWLLPGLAAFLIREHILLDITLDDQDHTYSLLAQGLALAGVSSQAQPMRGCASHSLGVMRYRLVCTPAYARKWFPHGLEREAARVAPLLVFDRKDDMPADYLQRELGLPPGSYPCFYVPSSDAFVTEARLGLGYGLVPELQCTALIKRGTLIDLAPAKPVDVHLYWHAWRVQSPKMERLSAQVVAAARKVLRRPSTRRGAASALTA